MVTKWLSFSIKYVKVVIFVKKVFEFTKKPSTYII